MVVTGSREVRGGISDSIRRDLGILFTWCSHSHLPAGKYPVPWRHSEEGADKHTKTKHRCSRVREFPGKWPPKGGSLSMPARMNKRMNRGWPAAVAPGPSPCACRPSLMRTSHPPREAPPDHSSALLGSRMPGTGRPVVPPPPSLLPPRLRWCLARHRGCHRGPAAAFAAAFAAAAGRCRRRRRRLTFRWRCTFSPSLATTSPIMPIMWSRSR